MRLPAASRATSTSWWDEKTRRQRAIAAGAQADAQVLRRGEAQARGPARRELVRRQGRAHALQAHVRAQPEPLRVQAESHGAERRRGADRGLLELAAAARGPAQRAAPALAHVQRHHDRALPGRAARAHHARAAVQRVPLQPPVAHVRHQLAARPHRLVRAARIPVAGLLIALGIALATALAERLRPGARRRHGRVAQPRIAAARHSLEVRHGLHRVQPRRGAVLSHARDGQRRPAAQEPAAVPARAAGLVRAARERAQAHAQRHAGRAARPRLRPTTMRSAAGRKSAAPNRHASGALAARATSA